MIAIEELRSLSVAERLQLVEELWNSIVREPNSMPDPPSVVAELRRRKARFMAKPASGIRWEHAREHIRSGGA